MSWFTKLFGESATPTYRGRFVVTSSVQVGERVQVTGRMLEGTSPSSGDRVVIHRTGKQASVLAATSMAAVAASLAGSVVMGAANNLASSIGVSLNGVSANEILKGDELHVI